MIPIVYGNLERIYYDLAILEKIAPGGCFAPDTGSPLWECAECGESLKDSPFTLPITNDFIYREYNRQIDDALKQHKNYTENEIDRASGRGHIKGIVNRNFLGNVGELQIGMNDQVIFIRRCYNNRTSDLHTYVDLHEPEISDDDDSLDLSGFSHFNTGEEEEFEVGLPDDDADATLDEGKCGIFYSMLKYVEHCRNNSSHEGVEEHLSVRVGRTPMKFSLSLDSSVDPELAHPVIRIRKV